MKGVETLGQGVETLGNGIRGGKDDTRGSEGKASEKQVWVLETGRVREGEGVAS